MENIAFGVYITWVAGVLITYHMGVLIKRQTSDFTIQRAVELLFIAATWPVLMVLGIASGIEHVINAIKWDKVLLPRMK